MPFTRTSAASDALGANPFRTLGIAGGVEWLGCCNAGVRLLVREELTCGVTLVVFSLRHDSVGRVDGSPAGTDRGLAGGDTWGPPELASDLPDGVGAIIAVVMSLC